ncbi:MAG: DUF3794 domain-containing protein [Limnochordaceae bacterium]|nr:DUF3794 domain-containing protein [Limnochordaceae bacterium]
MAVSRAASPQGGGPATKVKEIRAEALVREALVVPNAVVVQGSVHKQIFWVGVDGTVHHTPETLPFTQMIPVPGARPGMLAQVQSAVEHVAFVLSPDGTTVFEKVLVRSSAVAAELQTISIRTGTGPLVRVDEFIGQASAQRTVASQHALASPAVKLTEVRATLEAVTPSAGTDTVTVTGLLHYQIFYVGTDGRQHHQSAQAPFEVVATVPGSRPGDHATVSLAIVNLEPTLVDPTTVDVASLLGGTVVVSRARDVSVVAGEGPVLKLAQLVGEAPVTAGDTSDLVLSRQPAAVTGVVTTIGSVTARVHLGQVFISGTLVYRVDYVDAGTGEMRSESFTEPFSVAVDVPGAAAGMDASVQLDVTATVFELVAPSTVRVTGTLSGSVVVTQLILLPIEPGTDLTILAEVVVGTGTSQVLVERPVPIVPVAPEVLERVIRVEELVPVRAQSLVEALVPLPQPAVKIKDVRGEARLLGVEQFGPRALGVRGVLHLEVFVVGTDDIVHHVAFDQPFQILVSVPGPVGPDFRLELSIEKILPRLAQDGRAVSVVAVVRVSGGTASSRQVPVVLDILGADVTIDRIRARADLVQGEASLQHEVRGTVTLSPPAAPSVPVQVEAQPTGFSVQVGNGQALVLGTVRAALTYSAADGTLHRATAELPVELAVALPGVRPGMTPYLTVTVTGARATPAPGGASAEVAVQLSLLVKVTERVVLDLITDVRGPAVVSVERQTVLLDVVDDGVPYPVPVTIVTHVTLASDPLAVPPAAAAGPR